MITQATHVTLFVTNQNDAFNFFTEKLGFKLHTNAQFGSMRWLTIHPAGQPEFEIALTAPENKEEEALVGKQGAQKPFLTFSTDNCQKDFELFKSLGVKFHGIPKLETWGTAVAFEDLYGNIMYLCQTI